MQIYHGHAQEVETSQRHFMNQVTVQLIKKITNKHGIDYDKLPLGTRQVLYSTAKWTKHHIKQSLWYTLW